MSNRSLPTPDDLPQADVVIYDGSCPLCSGIAQRLHRLDGQGRLAFLTLGDPQVAQRYPDLSRAELLKYVYVIDRDGQRHQGAGAVRYLSRRLPALWPLAPLLHLPGSVPLWRWLYREVSEHRYWLSGKSK